MNASPFWPLVWKEYRTSRAFWLAMAAMGLVAQAGVYLLAHQPTNRDWWLYGIALMISAGFAVGIGGTLFAVEHEERTIALLRRLPVRAAQLGAAKMLSALAGLAALLAVLWLAASAMTGWQSLPAAQADQLWRMWGLACLEGLAWGILFSLTIRSPLYATVAAALTVTLIDSCAGLMTADREFSADVFAATIPHRTALLLSVALADAMLLPWWLAGRFPSRPPRPRAIRTARQPWRQSVSHLAWQTFREGRTSFLLLITAGPLTLLVLDGLTLHHLRWGLGLDPSLVTALFWTLAALGSLAAIDGALVFRADQIHGPRFLAEKGVSPRTLWFSRHLVWGFWLWALAAIIVCLFFGLLSAVLLLWLFGYDGPRDAGRFLMRCDRLFDLTLRIWQLLLPAYAAGQLASLLLRRGLLAVTLALVLGGLTSLWAALMLLIGASWWWSVLPLPIGMLLATWLRLPAWLIERRDWRSWVLPGAAVLVPVAALMAAVPAYRVMQISAHRPQLPVPSSSPAAVADARATLDLYTQAWDLYLATREESTEYRMLSDGGAKRRAEEGWRKPVVDLIMEASRHDASLLVLPVAERRASRSKIEKLADFLNQFAEDQGKTDQLEAALDAYLATLRLETQLHQCDGSYPSLRQVTFQRLRVWAAAPGQTAERIRGAIARLKECHAAFPTPEAWLLPEYEEAELTIADFPAAAAAEIVPAKKIAEADWITSRLPWERARARRLLDELTTWQLIWSGKTVEALAGDKPIEMIHPSPYQVARDGERERLATGKKSKSKGKKSKSKQVAPIAARSLPNPKEYDFRFLSRITGWLTTTPLVEHSPLASESLAWSILCEETDYRATLIILALQAWKAEHDHGELPERLDELVGSELDELPLDPLWARPFLYYPRGYGGFANEPFLWSVLNRWGDDEPNGRRGPFEHFYSQPLGLGPAVDSGRGNDLPYVRLDSFGQPVPSSPIEVLRAGQAYPIVQSQEKQR